MAGALFRLPMLNLNRVGTTLAADSLASNVITQAATIIKPFSEGNYKMYR